MLSTRKPYLSDVRDDEWTFVAPYLVLSEGARQRRYTLREVFNGLLYIVRTGAHWQMMPHDLPPSPVVYRQMRRWMTAGCFEAIVADLRMLLRKAAERQRQPTASIPDSRIVQSTPGSGVQARDNVAKGHKGSRARAEGDTLGELLASVVTPAGAQEQVNVADLAARLQYATGETVELAYVDHGYTGKVPTAAASYGFQLAVVTLYEAKRGFVLLPRDWVAERDVAWVTRFRRLVRNYERLAAILAGLQIVAFICLMLPCLTCLTLNP